jgi:hypothetical protein
MHYMNCCRFLRHSLITPKENTSAGLLSRPLRISSAQTMTAAKTAAAGKLCRVMLVEMYAGPEDQQHPWHQTQDSHKLLPKRAYAQQLGVAQLRKSPCCSMVLLCEQTMQPTWRLMCDGAHGVC